ncbi:translesion DNA synthesis-associated protein ImuA [Methylomonas sp. 2BW1-5-20]|uniref:translesion DNA synthesis-associated protein ImuA n=1 Tax=Methylomonas sp. 2BW1-5-20 TaxID=3376686 RepID=UPI00404CB2C7
MNNVSSLNQLLRSQTGIWRGLHSEQQNWRTIASGFTELDALLPGGGWPLGGVLEVLSPCLGIGELSLLLPAMAGMTQAKRWIAWIAPPQQVYAPALAQAGIDLAYVLVVDCRQAEDIPWSLEKLLRSGRCGMTLAWPRRLSDHQIRRLQLAAEAGSALTVLFPKQRSGSGYTALRLEVRPAETGLALHILKARGSLQRASLTLPL